MRSVGQKSIRWLTQAKPGICVSPSSSIGTIAESIKASQAGGILEGAKQIWKQAEVQLWNAMHREVHTWMPGAGMRRRNTSGGNVAAHAGWIAEMRSVKAAACRMCNALSANQLEIEQMSDFYPLHDSGCRCTSGDELAGKSARSTTPLRCTGNKYRRQGSRSKCGLQAGAGDTIARLRLRAQGERRTQRIWPDIWRMATSRAWSGCEGERTEQVSVDAVVAWVCGDDR